MNEGVLGSIPLGSFLHPFYFLIVAIGQRPRNYLNCCNHWNRLVVDAIVDIGIDVVSGLVFVIEAFAVVGQWL